MKQFLFCFICILGIISYCNVYYNKDISYFRCCSNIIIEDYNQYENANIGKYYKECSPNINIRGSDLSTKIGWHGKRINYK